MVQIHNVMYGHIAPHLRWVPPTAQVLHIHLTQVVIPQPRIGLLATGTYQVTCKGVGGGSWGGTPGGHVQVTAYGGGAGYCKIGNWANNGADFNGYVNCYNGAGVLTNSQFDLEFVW
jgi:hypothetical protein